MTTKSVLSPLLPEQCRAARALLDWSQEHLSERADIARKTLIDFEGGRSMPYRRTLEAIRKSLERAGIEFLHDETQGVGVRLKAFRTKAEKPVARPQVSAHDLSSVAA